LIMKNYICLHDQKFDKMLIDMPKWLKFGYT
jgi:hypothetical protein